MAATPVKKTAPPPVKSTPPVGTLTLPSGQRVSLNDPNIITYQKQAASSTPPAPIVAPTGGSSATPPAPTKPSASSPVSGSVVDYLASIGKPTDFASRSALATAQGITGYTGTAEQNLKLLGLLKGGSTGAPAAVTDPTKTKDPNDPFADLTSNDPYQAAILKALNSRSSEENSYLDFLKNQPSVVDTYNKLLESSGVNTKQAEVTGIATQVAKTQDLLDNLEKDINSRISGADVTEAQRRRILNVEETPLRDQYNKLLTNENTASAGLDTARSNFNQLLSVNQAEQARQAELLKAPMDMNTSNIDLLSKLKPDVKTQVVKLSNGSSVLVDTTTGKTIKTIDGGGSAVNPFGTTPTGSTPTAPKQTFDQYLQDAQNKAGMTFGADKTATLKKQFEAGQQLAAATSGTETKTPLEKYHDATGIWLNSNSAKDMKTLESWAEKEPTRQYQTVRAASLILNANGYKTDPVVTLFKGATPYLNRLDQAYKDASVNITDNPTAVAPDDLEIIDSFVGLTKGGNITEAQVSVMKDAKPILAGMELLRQKVETGSPLLDSQRDEIYQLSHNVYDAMKKSYVNRYNTTYKPALDNLGLGNYIINFAPEQILDAANAPATSPFPNSATGGTDTSSFQDANGNIWVDNGDGTYSQQQ